MNIISALIDFTDTSKVATQYACWLAKKEGASINLLHISNDNETSSTDIEQKLVEFTDISNCDIPYSISVGDGDYLKQIPRLLQLSDADLVIIGTHGVKGIFQTLFGANVVKLVQSLSISAIIVQDQTPSLKNGISKILFPMAPHDNFKVKIDSTVHWAKLLDAEVEVFCLFKQDGPLPDHIARNLELTKTTFTEEGLNFKVTLKDSKVYSVGYAREILEHAEATGANLISIMSQNSEENRYFGNVDKTNIVLNPQGIPVLCVAG